MPERLNGTDTQVGGGSGADEKRVMGTCPATLGNMASHLQAKKSKPHYLPTGRDGLLVHTTTRRLRCARVSVDLLDSERRVKKPVSSYLL